MKKRVIALALVLCMTLAMMPASLAFSDIPDNSESLAAESLASLSIIASGERFNPTGSLTRAEFCKMAVLAAGFTEEAMYGSFTSFPDVEANQWFAPYVNAAVKKYKLLNGYQDGTFQPNRVITFGEGVTILLRLLGYKTEDLGAFWPRDYILKAEQIGLTEGMKNLAYDGPLPRGQAAVLVRNLLLTKTKDGALFLSTGFNSASESSILTATWETDPTLLSGQVRIYNGTESSVVSLTGKLPSALVGLRGTCIFEKNNSTRLVGFLADTTETETFQVVKAETDKITTTKGELKIPRTARIIANGQVSDYVSNYYEAKADSTITVYYGSTGSVELISCQKSVSSYSATSIYGVDDVVFPRDCKIVKNGEQVTQDALEKFDALSYQASDNTYYVSTNRMTLFYKNATPSYSTPSTITLGVTKGSDTGDMTIAVPESATKYFRNSDLVFNKPITLIFDLSGQLCAVFPTSKVNAPTLGILQKLDDSSSTVKLLTSGYELSAPSNLSGFAKVYCGEDQVSSLYKSVGQLVKVSQNTFGQFSFSPVAYSTNLAGIVDPAAKTMGKYSFAANIRLFERPGEGMGLREIDMEDLGTIKLPASYVIHATKNSAGKIDLLVLDNITGDGFTYGLIRQTSASVQVGSGLNGDEIYRTQYTLNVKSAEYPTGTEYKTYYPSSLTNSLVPAAVATDVFKQKYSFATPARVIEKSATVDRDAFDAFNGVRIGAVYVPVVEKVSVYSKSLDRFMSLSEARANFSSFDLYCDRDPAYGGQVRLILVK